MGATDTVLQGLGLAVKTARKCENTYKSLKNISSSRSVSHGVMGNFFDTCADLTYSRSRLGGAYPMHRCISTVAIFLSWFSIGSLTAASIVFSTGSPDGKIATLSRPAGAAGLETETADDFILGQPAMITNATLAL